MYKIILIILIFVSFQNVFGADLNLKIYNSKIWLSQEKIFDGDKIRIYSEFKNPNDFDIKKTIQLFLDDKLIKEKQIEIAKKEKLVIWADVIITAGDHKIIAKTKEILKDELGKIEKIDAPKNENIKNIKIDWDNDKDRIGDSIDPDDDNDGYSDILEVEKGSDPKSANSIPLKKDEEIKKTEEKTKKEEGNKKNENEGKEEKTNSDAFLSNILKKLNEKRVILQKNIQEKKEEKEKTIENQKHEAEKIKIIKKETEQKLIEKYQKNKNFENKKNEIKKNFENLKTPIEIKNKADKEIEKILNSPEYEDKEFYEATVIQARDEKIEEIKNKKEPGLWTKLSFYILSFLTFILKSLFWTIIFFIVLIWILWKITKKLF